MVKTDLLKNHVISVFKKCVYLAYILVSKHHSPPKGIKGAEEWLIRAGIEEQGRYQRLWGWN